MDAFLDGLLHTTESVSNFLWGEWMIALLVGTGVLLTIVTRGKIGRASCRERV